MNSNQTQGKTMIYNNFLILNWTKLSFDTNDLKCFLIWRDFQELLWNFLSASTKDYLLIQLASANLSAWALPSNKSRQLN